MKTESLIQERRDESSRDSHPKQNEPKRFGLKEFLIFSYIAPLFLVFVYYLSPHLQTAMLFVTMYVLFFGMIDRWDDGDDHHPDGVLGGLGVLAKVRRGQA